jgi:hypothetical protein
LRNRGLSLFSLLFARMGLLESRLAGMANREKKAEGESRGGRVQAIDRAFVLLEHIARAPQGPSALELAEATELDRTTVHRLLRTLAHWRVVEARGPRYQAKPVAVPAMPVKPKMPPPARG